MFESSQNQPIRSPGTELNTNLTTGLFTPQVPREEKGLALVLTSLRKYWYLAALLSSLVMAGITYKTMREPRIYKSSIQIAIELKNVTIFTDKNNSTTESNATTADDRSTTLDTISQKLKSKTMVQKAIASIPNPKLRPSVDTVLKNLTIQPGQNTNILAINYTDTVPDRIVATLNALTKVYIEHGTRTKKARTDNSIAFIKAQLPASEERVRKSSKEIKDFRRKNEFIDSGKGFVRASAGIEK
jgi:polysaccharide biosynthesis transport protein